MTSVLATAPFRVRPIAAQDDAAVQHIIETVMPEFGANGAGFAIHDPEVKAMYAAYQIPGARYFVVELDGKVAGAGGVAELVGVAATCELRKMYFLPQLRGLGAGQALMQSCLHAARELGYRHVYLETLTGMDAAVKLYEHTGFQRLTQAMGATGHFGCNRFYLLNL
jgi:putative acetyltransferase